MRALASGAGIASALVLALIAVVFCFWPISGRSAEEWLPVVCRHVARRVRGQQVQLSPRAASRSATRDRRPTGAGRRAPRRRHAISNCSPLRSRARRSA